MSIQGQGKPRSRLNSKVHIEQLFKHCSNIKRSMSLENLFDSLRNILNISIFYSLISQFLQTKLSLEATMQFLLHLLVFLQQKNACTIVQASQFDKGISTVHPYTSTICMCILQNSTLNQNPNENANAHQNAQDGSLYKTMQT